MRLRSRNEKYERQIISQNVSRIVYFCYVVVAIVVVVDAAALTYYRASNGRR